MIFSMNHSKIFSKGDFLLCSSSQNLERKVATGTISYDEVGCGSSS
jgi:hypothetical protein